jgi:aromatic ring-opening dioxygenase catalytic subunit (LigB family)
MTDRNEILAPVVYLPHGGGPLPLLGDAAHEKLITFLKNLPLRVTKPAAILVVSAHWEEKLPTITSASHPKLVYDYKGFPEKSYQIQYPAPGSPGLAETLRELLAQHEIDSVLDNVRGFDHGMFVPLKLMYPEADVPCIQLSLMDSLDPGDHIRIGKAIADIRKKNVMILGSGFSYHNMADLMAPTEQGRASNVDFDFWLVDACTSGRYELDEREQMLIEWENAPSARESHPREEHLLPLHVCLGAASLSNHGATAIFNDDVIGRRASAFFWT